MTPDSLTARIRGLNELTSDLNAYLKEYCMSEGFDRLKQELETITQEMTAKVEGLETELADKESVHTEKIRSLTEDHEGKMSTLNERIEELNFTFEKEKIKIE